MTQTNGRKRSSTSHAEAPAEATTARCGLPAQQRNRSAEIGTLESRPEAEIFRARWRCQSLIESSETLTDLPWDRITDDPVYRTDFIAALYDLYLTNRRTRGKLSPVAACFGSGLDGSEGNSGKERGSLPEHLAP